jgi:hypothetical protein
LKIYIGAKWSQREEMRKIRQELFRLGHEVVGTWIDEGDSNDFENNAVLQPRIAQRDVTQISIAELFILDTQNPLSEGSGGGREFEYGFAFGQFQHKICWRVGPVRNPFHHLVNDAFDNWSELIECLEKGVCNNG